MTTSSPVALHQLGMHGSACPVSRVLSSNVTRSFGKFTISYNRSSAGYGSDTTSIGLDGRVFFVLDGSHGAALCAIGEQQGMQGFVDYFIAHIGKANQRSEHWMAAGLRDDPFGLQVTAVELMGQANLERIAKAAA